jgi:hypothetical protein
LRNDIRISGERSSPVRIELVSQCGHSDRVQPVDPASSDGAFGDQTGVLEDLQVLRNGGSGDRQFGGEFPDRHRVIRQACDDRAPRAIRQRTPTITISVSVH